MPGVVIGGRQFQIPGFPIQNFLDNPKFKLKINGPGSDGCARPRSSKWRVRNICYHTTEGKNPVILNPGAGPDRKLDEIIVKSWKGSIRQAAAQMVGDFDGSGVCCADLLEESTYHATTVNDVSVGYEIGQGSTGNTWESEYDSLLAWTDFVTLAFGIQRFFQHPYDINAIPRIRSGARDVVGVYCHYHQTRGRGPGDCGPRPFVRLDEAKYKPVDYSRNEDLDFMEDIQRNLLGLTGDDVDGAAGPGTVKLLKTAGYKYGQLIARPNDDLYASILGISAK